MTTSHDTADLWRGLRVAEINGERRLLRGDGQPLTIFQILPMLAVSEGDLAEMLRDDIIRDDEAGLLPGPREVLLEGAQPMAAAYRLLLIQYAICCLDAPACLADRMSDHEIAVVESWAQDDPGAAALGSDDPR